MKVIIGAGNTRFDGWVSTQENELNLLERKTFESMFKDEKPTAFLAEHVWEAPLEIPPMTRQVYR